MWLVPAQVFLCIWIKEEWISSFRLNSAAGARAQDLRGRSCCHAEALNSIWALPGIEERKRRLSFVRCFLYCALSVQQQSLFALTDLRGTSVPRQQLEHGDYFSHRVSLAPDQATDAEL